MIDLPQISMENLKDLIQGIYALKQKEEMPSHSTGQSKSPVPPTYLIPRATKHFL